MYIKQVYLKNVVFYAVQRFVYGLLRDKSTLFSYKTGSLLR
jgi:hypothetical protein